MCRVVFAVRDVSCDLQADGPIIAIATSAGDLAVYTLNDMRRRYHMSNVTALLMPHELMSCPDFTGHVIISITAVYSPAQTVASVPSDARASSQALLLLGLSCGIVIAVDAGVLLFVNVIVVFITLSVTSLPPPSSTSLQPPDHA